MSVTKTIFRPGVSLMHRLPLRFKLWGMMALIALPISVTLWQAVAQQSRSVDYTLGEIEGVAVNRHVYGLLRGTLFNGDVADDLAAVTERVEARSEPGLTAAWESLQAWARAVRENGESLAPRSAEGLARAAWRMTLAQGEAYGLMFEADARESLNIDLVQERLIRPLAEVMRLKAALSGTAADPEAVASMQHMLGAMTEEALVVSRAYDGVGGDLPPSFAPAIQAARELAALPFAKLDIAATDTLLQFLFSAHEDLNRQLAMNLEARATAQSTRMWVDGVVSALLLVLLAYAPISMMRAMSESVVALRETIGLVSDGDLSRSSVVPGTDAIARLGATLEEMTEDLSVRIGKIRSEAMRVTMAAAEIAKANRDLMDRTELSVTSLTETTASIHSLDQSVGGSAAAAREAEDLVTRVRGVAEDSSGTMAEAVRAMQELQVDSGKMVEIIGAIDGIAFQTNILALNASVEAARAGEAGRGFAVVASEVRSLAQRCADSAQQVRDLIERSNSRVEIGAVGIDAVSHALEEILTGVRDASGKVMVIAQSTADQAQSLSEITAAVNQLETISEQNAVMVDRTMKAADALNDRSAGLTNAVGGMSLRRGTADEAYDMVMRARKIFERQGFTAARAAIHDQNGEFRDRDLYVFAFDRARMFEIYGADPAKAGHTTVDDLPGLDGEHLYRAGWEAAERGGDWIEYNVRNPVSGAIEPKISYIVGVGDYVVGCGVYKPIPKHEREAMERARREAAEQAEMQS